MKDRTGDAEDLVPGNEIARVRADLFDDTGYFGAEDQRIRLRHAAVAGSNQRVPRAHTCRPNSDYNFLAVAAPERRALLDDDDNAETQACGLALLA